MTLYRHMPEGRIAKGHAPLPWNAFSQPVGSYEGIYALSPLQAHQSRFGEFLGIAARIRPRQPCGTYTKPLERKAISHRRAIDGVSL